MLIWADGFPSRAPLYCDERANDGATLIQAEPTRDGPDYRLLCLRHQWASHPLPDRALLPECPGCLAELDLAAGRERYAQLQRR